MKQIDMFGEGKVSNEDNPYTSKIKAPTYEPKNRKPHPLELVDTTKASRLVNEINASNVTDAEKKFLISAAQRHNVFNYGKIADYYAHSSKEMQNLMEKSALVVIDFDKAYHYGYIKLASEIAGMYLDTVEGDE